MELLITLGHNSSAIIVNEGKVIAGYEEERHERLKSSSIFPINSIKKCIELAKPNKNDDNKIFVSHWFDDFNFQNNNHEKIQGKYWNKDYIQSLVDEYNFQVISLNEDFTHHDAHAYAVTGFYEFHSNEYKTAMIMVVDGFGNRQEVISIYKLTYNGIGLRNIELEARYDGYSNSMGLMYQFATAFVGMKENQDEYKFLGYESHIREVLDNKNYELLQKEAEKFKTILLNNIKTPNIIEFSDDYINLKDLDRARDYFNAYFSNIVNIIDFDKSSDFNLRVVIGNFIQTVLEGVLSSFVIERNPDTLLVNGGVFYNVKLNNKLERLVNKFSVLPLAGDQGAAIGLYIKYMGPFNFSNLFWGKRTLKEDVTSLTDLPENVEIYDNKEKMVNRIVELLKDNKIPQIVVGDMEFGPRALCHSTTFAIPYKSNVELINNYNKRNTVMPMAPIILRKNLSYFFDERQYNKTIGSDGFMILTYDYQIKYQELYAGVMHKYPNEELYSGRPQVVEDDNSTVSLVLKGIENKTKALINTSYNMHGKPIVFTVQHAVDDFKFQLSRCKELNLEKPYLLIGTYDE